MAPDEARARRRTRLIRATLAAGLPLLLIGVGDRRTGLIAVHGEATSDTVQVGVQSCNAHPRIRVEESTTRVTLTAFIDREGILDGQGDCADGAVVRLAAPLGTRAVVDGSDDERLAVSAPD
jgi:hypothetical protein